MPALGVIAFDADDTLWHNEVIYLRAKKKLVEILSPHTSFDDLEDRLDETESMNISLYGYGITSFTLSMIEVAISTRDENITANEIRDIISLGKRMLEAEVELFDHVEETISRLAEEHKLMIITKGHLLDQERKLSISGIDHYFDCIEVVSEKNQQTYQNILSKYNIQPSEFLMVGNSLKSDIEPVIRIGGRAVHIPAEIHWRLDTLQSTDLISEKYHEIKHMGELRGIIDVIQKE